MVYALAFSSKYTDPGFLIEASYPFHLIPKNLSVLAKLLVEIKCKRSTQTPSLRKALNKSIVSKEFWGSIAIPSPAAIRTQFLY